MSYLSDLLTGGTIDPNNDPAGELLGFPDIFEVSQDTPPKTTTTTTSKLSFNPLYLVIGVSVAVVGIIIAAVSKSKGRRRRK